MSCASSARRSPQRARWGGLRPLAGGERLPSRRPQLKSLPPLLLLPLPSPRLRRLHCLPLPPPLPLPQKNVPPATNAGT